MIRRAKPEDYLAVREIGRLTWEGHDYLPKVFHEWLENGNFFVVDVDGKAVAAAKLTILPCGVGWLEGLRVHPSHRGKGYAAQLHEFLISYGKELASRGVISSLMFATYIKNEASIHLGLKRGFRIVKRFYHLLREVKGGTPIERAEPEIPDIDIIPVGWRFLKRCEETGKWLRRNVKAYKVNGAGFFIPQEPPIAFTPFRYDAGILKAVEGMGTLANRMDRRDVDIMVPEDLPDVVYLLGKRGSPNGRG